MPMFPSKIGTRCLGRCVEECRIRPAQTHGNTVVAVCWVHTNTTMLRKAPNGLER